MTPFHNVRLSSFTIHTHCQSLFFRRYCLVTTCICLPNFMHVSQKRRFVLSDPILQCENVIVYNPHTLLDSIFFVFIFWQLLVSVYQFPCLYLKNPYMCVASWLVDMLRCTVNPHYTPHTETLKYLFLYLQAFQVYYNVLYCILLLDNVQQLATNKESHTLSNISII